MCYGPPVAPGGLQTPSGFPDLTLDEKLVEKVITLTGGPGFAEEWKDYPSDPGTDMRSSFLRQRVRLSSKNRMVIEETGTKDCRPGPGPLLETCVREACDRTLIAVLSGRSPGSGGAVRILDPCPGTGRSLSSAYARLLEWHLSWYGAHLVPLLKNGKDPSSRSVQNSIPKPVLGIEMPGFSPLPVCDTGNGDYCLTWGEKARILAESMFATDGDPQTVMVTRLSLLSLFLDRLTYPDLESFKPDLIIGILFRNIGHRYVLGTETGEIQRIPASTWLPCDGASSATGIFPGVDLEGGFDLVICQLCRPSMKNENEIHDPHPRSRKAAVHTEDPEQAYIKFGLSVLKEGGMYCGTGTGRWMRDPRASRFRGWLAGFQLKEIISFQSSSRVKRTETAPVVTSIVNTPVARTFIVGIAGEITGNGEGDPCPMFSREVEQSTLGQKPWMLFDINPVRLRNLIRSRGSPLSQVLLGEYFRPGPKVPGGLLISRERAVRVLKKDPVMRSFLLPFVCSGEISPYSPLKTESTWS